MLSFLPKSAPLPRFVSAKLSARVFIFYNRYESRGQAPIGGDHSMRTMVQITWILAALCAAPVCAQSNTQAFNMRPTIGALVATWMS